MKDTKNKHVLSGKVLLRARKEGLGEEKARDPEAWRRALVVPLLQELQGPGRGWEGRREIKCH